MNIRELIDQLESFAEEHGDETEVRFAHQPNWPFEYAISSVEAVDLSEPDEDEDSEEELSRREDSEPNVVVYLAEGSQLGYLPGAASKALGWR